MPLTPNDLLEKKFSIRFRGYDRQEVAAFLEEAANSLAAVVKERNELRDKLLAYKKQIVHLKQQESEFRNALTTAHQVAEEMRINAEKEGGLIIERARIDAERIVEDAHQEAIQLEDRIRKLRMLQRESVHKMRSSFEGFLRILDDEMMLPPVEMDEALRETATQIRTIQEEEGASETDSKMEEEKEEEALQADSPGAAEEGPAEEKAVKEETAGEEEGPAGADMDESDKITEEDFNFEPGKLWPDEEKKQPS